jgi:MOSC domain-containing protein YiiM
MFIMGIARHAGMRAPMQELRRVEVTEETGFEGDLRSVASSHQDHQISCLCAHQWEEACRQLGVALPWPARRANLLLDCLSFDGESLGKRIFFDGGVMLRIIGENTSCKRMDGACRGLRKILSRSWRGGVTCQVLRGGILPLGARFAIL